MFGYKRRNVVNSFWDNYADAGFDKNNWREASKSQYRYTSIEQDNGELIVEGLRQTSSARILCAISDVTLYLWTRPDKKYMCLMFHEAGQNDLYVHNDARTEAITGQPLHGYNYAVWEGCVNENWTRVPSPDFDKNSIVYYYCGPQRGRRRMINAISSTHPDKLIIVSYNLKD